MVNAVASSNHKQITKRQPLIPSDSDNEPPRRPKAREVSSRYLSLSTSSSSSSNSSSSTNTTSSSTTFGTPVSSRRYQSLMVGGNRAGITTPKSQQRAMSAERRRPAAAMTPSNAEKILATSVRSLSVSFQGDSYRMPASKVKPPPVTAGTPGSIRKATPERRKAGMTPVRDRRDKDRENSKPNDQPQHLWPARLRGEKSFLTRSLDYGASKVKPSESGFSLKELRKSVDNGNSRNQKVGVGLKLENKNVEVQKESELRSRSSLSDPLNSGPQSVSSRNTQSGKTIQLRGGPHRSVVPARNWQDGSNRVNKELDPSSPISRSVSSRTLGPSKLIASKKIQNDSPVSSPRKVFSSRGLSPLRGGVRAASPSKALSSSTGAPLIGMPSPTRGRSNTGNSMDDFSICSTSSMVSFATDVRRGKFGENRIDDAHNLRLLYNRHLQWRLVNARVGNTLMVQRHKAERSLYNAWVNTSKLWHAVKSKRIELQLLRHNVKLYSILKEQEPQLDNWGLFEEDHSRSISGAIEALVSCTIRLPVDGGARVDIKQVQEALCSAIEMMQTMASSVHSLLTKVEQMNLLVSELSNVSASECRLLEECRDLLTTTFIPLQVMYCSLTTHVLQVHHANEIKEE